MKWQRKMAYFSRVRGSKGLERPKVWEEDRLIGKVAENCPKRSDSFVVVTFQQNGNSACCWRFSFAAPPTIYFVNNRFTFDFTSRSSTRLRVVFPIIANSARITQQCLSLARVQFRQNGFQSLKVKWTRGKVGWLSHWTSWSRRTKFLNKGESVANSNFFQTKWDWLLLLLLYLWESRWNNFQIKHHKGTFCGWIQ